MTQLDAGRFDAYVARLERGGQVPPDLSQQDAADLSLAARLIAFRSDLKAPATPPWVKPGARAAAVELAGQDAPSARRRAEDTPAADQQGGELQSEPDSPGRAWQPLLDGSVARLRRWFSRTDGPAPPRFPEGPRWGPKEAIVVALLLVVAGALVIRGPSLLEPSSESVTPIATTAGTAAPDSTANLVGPTGDATRRIPATARTSTPGLHATLTVGVPESPLGLDLDAEATASVTAPPEARETKEQGAPTPMPSSSPELNATPTSIGTPPTDTPEPSYPPPWPTGTPTRAYPPPVTQIASSTPTIDAGTSEPTADATGSSPTATTPPPASPSSLAPTATREPPVFPTVPPTPTLEPPPSSTPFWPTDTAEPPPPATATVAQLEEEWRSRGATGSGLPPAKPRSRRHVLGGAAQPDSASPFHLSRWTRSATKRPNRTVAGGGPAIRLAAQYGGSVDAVAVSGRYAYVGVGPRLVTIDIAEPSAPVTVGTSPVLPDIVRAVAVSGSYAYVAAGAEGELRIYDVSDPTQSLEVGIAHTPGDARDVAVADGHAYVADGPLGGLRVIDVSDPTRPRELSAVDTPEDANRVAVEAGYAYVADGAIDAAPWYTGRQASLGSGALRVIDVRDPRQPREVALVDPGGSVHTIDVAGDLAYVTVHTGSSIDDAASRFAVLDVSDPESPTVKGSTEIGDGWFRDLAVAQERAYVLAEGLRVVDVSEPAAPRLLGAGAAGCALAAAAEHVYIAGQDRGFSIVDVTDGSRPRTVGHLEWPSYTHAIAASDGAAFTLTWSGLWTFEPSPLVPLDVRGHYRVGDGAPSALLVDGERLYLGVDTSWLSRIEVLDVSDLALPGRVGFLEGGYALAGLALAGEHLFVTEESEASWLRVIDVRDPTKPRLIGYDDSYSGPNAIVQGDYLYTAAYWLGVFDVADLRRPTLVDTHKEFHGSALAARDGLLYLLSGDELQIVDISRPVEPQLRGRLGLPKGHRAIALWRDYAVLAAGFDGVALVDVSDTENPYEAAVLDTPGWAWGVAVAGDRAWVADYDGGVLALDLEPAGDEPGPSPTPRPTATRAASPTSRPTSAPGPTSETGRRTSGLSRDSGPAQASFLPRTDDWDCEEATLELADQFGGVSRAVAGEGAYAYVGLGPRVLVVDASTAGSPEVTARSDILAGLVTDIAVEANLVVATLDDGGWATIDVRAPGSPELLATTRTPGRASAVALNDSRAYVGCTNEGLFIYDLSAPAEPVLVGSHAYEGEPTDLALVGDLVVIGDRYEGLRLIDVANPAAPALISQLPLAGEPSGLDVSGAHAFVASGAEGMHVVDISDSAAPRHVGNLPQPTWRFGAADGAARDVAVADGRAHVAGSFWSHLGGHGVRVADVSDPANPVDLRRPSGAWPAPAFVPAPAPAVGIAVVGDLAFVAATTGGLQIVDLSTPARPVERGCVDTIGRMSAIGGRIGMFERAALGSEGVISVDFRIDGSIYEVARYRALDGARWLAGVDRFLVNGRGELRILAQPRANRLQGVGYGGWWAAQDALVVHDLLYVASGEHGLRVLDVSDPLTPEPVFAVEVQGALERLRAAGELVLGAAREGGLIIFDASEPGQPVAIASVPNIYGAVDMIADGSYVYVADTTAGVWVVDISEPASPQVLGVVRTPGNPQSLALEGRRLWVADGPGGVHLLDLSSPHQPRITRSLAVPGGAWGLDPWLHSSRSIGVLVAAGEGGLAELHLRLDWGETSIYLPSLSRQ